ncbi:MAG: hypothetical protein WBA83_10075 [Burkholderiaceae bacterium]
MNTGQLFFAGIAMLATLISPEASADPDRINTTETRAVVASLGEKMAGDLFPSSVVPGYMIARGSAGAIMAAQQKLKNMPNNFNPEDEILSPLRTVEATWPDYQSENGQRVRAELWSCRDAVTLMRMSMEYATVGDVSGVKDLKAVQDRKSMACIAALTAIKAEDKK